MSDLFTFTSTELLAALVCVFFTVQLSSIATTVYLHRALSHRAVALAPSVEFFMRIVIWTTTGIEPRQWAAVHRKHHKFSDADGDPHSPYVHGFWQIQLWNYFYYRREASNQETIERFTRDMRPDAWDRVLNWSWLGMGLFWTALMLAFGPVLGTLAMVSHMVLYVFLNSSINGAAHWIGYQRFPNSARNMWFLALLTGGEGLHNNHHEFPGSSRFSHRWWEIDLGWYAIALLNKLGLATPAASTVIREAA